MISLSFLQVFYSKLAETKGCEKLLKMYLRFARNLTLIACLPVLFVYFLPIQFVTYILGESWSELLPIARIIVIWLAVWFVSSSLFYLYAVRKTENHAVL